MWSAAEKIRMYCSPYGRNRHVPFLPACMSASGRIHGKFLRLLLSSSLSSSPTSRLTTTSRSVASTIPPPLRARERARASERERERKVSKRKLFTCWRCRHERYTHQCKHALANSAAASTRLRTRDRNGARPSYDATIDTGGERNRV